MFSGTKIGDASGFFTSSDGRRIPYFEGFAKKIIDYKRLTGEFFSYNPALILRKASTKRKRTASELLTCLKYVACNKPLKILDIATGSGCYAICWAKAVGSQVTAVDCSPWFLSISSKVRSAMNFWLGRFVKGKMSAVRRYAKLGVDYKKMNSNNLRFNNETFDLVTCYNSFMEIKDIEKVLAEISRVLKPKGILIASWDNFGYWLGSHRKGAIDIPWGHKLLSKNDISKFIAQRSCKYDAAATTRYIDGLNKFNENEWKKMFEKRFKIIRWQAHMDKTSMAYAPKWLKDALPRGSKMNELFIHNYHGVFRKPCNR